ncbi:unnamed protein product [Adineta steineri]|uniref:Uncharacterized protein n=1 Tax=Adineta steineri TaxID=433720 RepID=A0A818VPK6_9BILA|nr:unnamed protein product [Adineta steineri]CAF3714100.1 unnamed protein product [Adineta steineri]
MDWSFYSLWDILPLPIIIGMFIWTFSMCFFSLFLLFILILLQKRSCPVVAELVSIKKDLSNVETVRKEGFSCDSLSLISIESTQYDNSSRKISSFYLRNNSNCLKENSRIHSLPSIKLNPIVLNQDKQINTLPLQLSTRRSIIKDLTSVANSYNDQIKIHQSVDSLFSKDSLIE